MTAYSVPEVIDENTPQPVKDFYNYYRNPERGYHKRSINSGIATDVAASTSYFHFSMFTYIDQIENPVLLVHGDQAYTYPEAKGLFDRMKGDNKKFYTVTGASHTDLYDQVDKIPFDEIEKFYREYFV